MLGGTPEVSMLIERQRTFQEADHYSISVWMTDNYVLD